MNSARAKLILKEEMKKFMSAHKTEIFKRVKKRILSEAKSERQKANK